MKRFQASDERAARERGRAVPSSKTPFSFIAEKLKEYDSNVVATFIVIFTLSVSTALGYVARDIAFAASDFWLRHNLPPTRSLPTILKQISVVYGSEKVASVTRNYPVFRLGEENAPDLSLSRSPEAYVREYCKMWLSQKAPTLNTEGLEIEINMAIGLVNPIAFGGLTSS